MATTINGKVSRVLKRNEAISEPGRIFFRPNNPADRRKVDGSRCAGVDEIASTVGDDAASFAEGDAVAYDLESGKVAKGKGGKQSDGGDAA